MYLLDTNICIAIIKKNANALIAGVARSRNDILVTDNTRHFQNIVNLQLENWLEN